jgi:hypothetical protein
MRWEWYVACMRSSFRILIGKDNIKIDFKEIELEVLDWIHLFQDRDRWRALVDTAMNIRVP